MNAHALHIIGAMQSVSAETPLHQWMQLAFHQSRILQPGCAVAGSFSTPAVPLARTSGYYVCARSGVKHVLQVLQICTRFAEHLASCGCGNLSEEFCG